MKSPLATPLPPSVHENLHQLLAMGFPKSLCCKALQVSGGDLEQSIGYLLMEEASQKAFDNISRESISDAGNNVDLLAPPSEADFALPALSTTDKEEQPLSQPLPLQGRVSGSVRGSNETDPVENQLISMGYSKQQAHEAVRVADGDVYQAINFLLLGESRHGFVLDTESILLGRNRLTNRAWENSFKPDAVGAVVPDGPIQASTAESCASSALRYNPPPYNGPKPKIVTTRAQLRIPDARAFCTCLAASRFLKGGVVTGPFLNGILESGIELYRKENRAMTVETVLKKYGRSHLGGIQTTMVDPKRGIYDSRDLHQQDGVRKLMATCRNLQRAGWQVLLMELQTSDAFCLCFPPKGSSNKFWFFDFHPRSNFNTHGAYALVHNSLLQLEETIEAVMNSIGRQEQVNMVCFTLYRIQKLG